MRYIKNYKTFEAISSLLNIHNNVDEGLMNVIDNISYPGSSILEIACGNAEDSLYLQKKGYKVTCTDLDDGYIKNAIDKGLNCIKHDTKKKFPFSDNEFDLVYSRLGLHYFTKEELNEIFREIRRIGKKLLMSVKIQNDNIKTNKIILTPGEWKEIISNFFEIEDVKIREGKLYGEDAKWMEIIAK